MNVRPSAVFEAVIETGDPDLAATIGVELNDNQGITSIGFTTVGISEIATGVFAVAALTAPDAEGQYTLIWRDGAGGEVVGIEDVTVTSSAPADPSAPADSYATVDEFKVKLNMARAPSAEQLEQMERVLVAAAGEINAEIGRTDDLEPWMVALATQVNLDRAYEHWQQMENPFGIVSLGDAELAHTARDSWDRHAHKLAPLKQSWGIG
jgi:hypothetical protein